jgi:uncharacterized membrane protein YqhA
VGEGGGKFLRLLAETRLVIMLGAFASLVASVVLLVASVLAVARISWESVTDREVGEDQVEHLTIEFLSTIDAILLGVVLYIIALGLYQLFFHPDLPLPEWLRFDELTELKEALVEVIIVLLGVRFVAQAVVWQEGGAILEYGLATAAIIVALGFVLVVGHVRRGGELRE